MSSAEPAEMDQPSAGLTRTSRIGNAANAAMNGCAPGDTACVRCSVGHATA